MNTPERQINVTASEAARNMSKAFKDLDDFIQNPNLETFGDIDVDSLAPIDQKYIRRLLKLAESDLSILKKVMLIRHKLNLKIRLEQDEATLLLETLNAKHFGTNLDLSAFEFDSLEMNDAVIKGDLYMIDTIVKGNNNQRRMKVEGDNFQQRMRVEGTNFQSEMKVDGDNYQDNMKIAGDNDQDIMKIEGDNWQGGIRISGENSQVAMQIEGDNNQEFMRVDGDSYQEGMEVGGDNNQCVKLN